MLLGRLLGYSRGAARNRADELLDAFDIAEAAGRLVKQAGAPDGMAIGVSLAVALAAVFVPLTTRLYRSR